MLRHGRCDGAFQEPSGRPALTRLLDGCDGDGNRADNPCSFQGAAVVAHLLRAPLLAPAAGRRYLLSELGASGPLFASAGRSPPHARWRHMARSAKLGKPGHAIGQVRRPVTERYVALPM